MAFGEAVVAEAFHLAEAAHGEAAVIPVPDHTADERLLELADPAVALEGRHGAAQPVGFAV